MRVDGLRKDRNDLLARNGLLFDDEGKIFDLTEWYKANGVSQNNQNLSIQLKILTALDKIETHLSLITGEELKQTDIEQDEEL